MFLKNIMFLWFLLLGSVLSTPVEEIGNSGVGDVSKEGDITNIAPSNTVSDVNSSYSDPDEEEWSAIFKSNSDSEFFQIFNKHVEKGTTSRHLTFCIYDDNMREAAVALFRIFQNTVDETFERVKNWTKKNVNPEIYMYALRLESLYSSKTSESALLPPFVWNPHYFVNGESIAKISIILNDIMRNPIEFTIGIDKQLVVVHTNYSGWNLERNGKKDILNYFREDISLNSYYLGIHLLHPFWMTDEELRDLNPRFAEHYYYAHHQLMARFNLEKLHIKSRNISCAFDTCVYESYLRYKNGLPFPTRSCVLGNWSNEYIYLEAVDKEIREFISKGLKKNEEALNWKNDSDINVLAKLIRDKIDEIKLAKIIRSIVGYAGDAFLIDQYNPAPSLLHHPETSLRDPAYWFMIQHMLNYYTQFKREVEHFDMSQHETDEFEIIDSHFTPITTYFNNYRFPVNQATSNYILDEQNWMVFLKVGQRRLKHTELSLKFKVDSKVEKDTIVRLYLGPECSNKDCWRQFNDYFELDTFQYSLRRGINVISWSPASSNKYSFDDYFGTAFYIRQTPSNYSIFRFPENLLIPRGLKEGLNLTLFVIITPDDDGKDPHVTSFYREVSNELDSKPLGFPFHRQAKGFKDAAFNYKFYNISIYHKSEACNEDRPFSPDLY